MRTSENQMVSLDILWQLYSQALFTRGTPSGGEIYVAFL